MNDWLDLVIGDDNGKVNVLGGAWLSPAMPPMIM
jgi:hypothetical protein